MLIEATLQEGQRRGYEPKGSANSSFVPVHPTSLPATAQCQLAQGVLLTFEFAEREFSCSHRSPVKCMHCVQPAGKKWCFQLGFLILGAVVSCSTIRSCLTNGFTQFCLLHTLPLLAPTVLRGLILKESCGIIPSFFCHY